MTDTEEQDAVVTAIRTAERCDAYYGQEPNGMNFCDGLEACTECLRNAAAEVLAVLDVRRTRGAA